VTAILAGGAVEAKRVAVDQPAKPAQPPAPKTIVHSPAQTTGGVSLAGARPALVEKAENRMKPAHAKHQTTKPEPQAGATGAQGATGGTGAVGTESSVPATGAAPPPPVTSNSTTGPQGGTPETGGAAPPPPNAKPPAPTAGASGAPPVGATGAATAPSGSTGATGTTGP
jgi:hypothetical protein